PVNRAPRNLLGVRGAQLARGLFDSLGVAVYCLLGLWLTAVAFLLLRRHWGRWGIRLVGWLLLASAVAAAATLWGGRLGDVRRQRGGAIGAWLAAELTPAVPPFWLPFAVVSAGVIGLLASLDFLVFPVLRTGGRLVLRRKPAKRLPPRRGFDDIPLKGP